MSTIKHQADEIESDIWHLYHLLDTSIDLLMNENNPVRLAALLWIARDRAESIGANLAALTVGLSGDQCRREVKHEHH
ncbi:MAG TPA: hypothetical protein VNQ99_04785 [Xanthobacteraceae bacterium]|nr:hypothetical protein [Xanthobacteraceae bacterium]